MSIRDLREFEVVVEFPEKGLSLWTEFRNTAEGEFEPALRKYLEARMLRKDRVASDDESRTSIGISHFPMRARRGLSSLPLTSLASSLDPSTPEPPVPQRPSPHSA